MYKVTKSIIENITNQDSSIIDKCLINNKKYSEKYDKSIYNYRAPPSEHLAVITCMDARLNVFEILGINEGNAHIIRNGGGRIRDATRSLICSQTLLQTNKVMIIHHTDCGFQYFNSNTEVLSVIKVKTGTDISKKTSFFKTMSNDLGIENYNNESVTDFMPIKDLEQSIHDDFKAYREQPMFNQNVEIRGFIYDTETGILKEVYENKE